MPSIAVIDDRPESRQTVRRTVDRGLRLKRVPGWETIESDPLEDLDDYPSWLSEHEVAVLLLDERLNEGSSGNDITVGYQGHDLVSYLRPRYPGLPIYVITAFEIDEDLQRHFAEVDEIVSRPQFAERGDEYVERLLRRGTSYYEEHREELARLAELVTRVVTGEADGDEVKEVAGLQLKIGMPFHLMDRSDWLSAFEQKLISLEELASTIRRHLDDTGPRNEVDSNPKGEV